MTNSAPENRSERKSSIEKVLLTFFLICAALWAGASFAQQPPTLIYGQAVDADNYGVLLSGSNYDSQTYVDIRSTTGSTILLSVLPPNVTFLPGTQVTTPSGTQNGMLSFRINDPTLQNLFATQGLRFAVVSPTAGYQWAGLLTLSRPTPPSTPSAFHSVYFHPAHGSFWAALADDTGTSPTPREKMIASIYGQLQTLSSAKVDTITVPLHDNDNWPSQTGGGFTYDPINFPTPQFAVAQEILLRIASHFNIKVIFTIAVDAYRLSTDGRSAWAGLADQYDNSAGTWDFYHAQLDPTVYYGTPSTTKLSTVGLTDGNVRTYFNDPRVVGWILAPELNPNVISSTGVATHRYFINKYWSNFYNLVHWSGSNTGFAAVYLVGSQCDPGVAPQISAIKALKSWFASGTGNPQPDQFGIEFYGSLPGCSGYPVQNSAEDMHLLVNAAVNADAAHYPGDYAIAPSKVFLAEGGVEAAANAYTNQYFQYMVQLLLKRSLGGIQWFSSETMQDGTPPNNSDSGYNLYNWSFTSSGTRTWTSLPSGKSYHVACTISPSAPWCTVNTNYADPTTFQALTGSFATQYGLMTYTSPTAKGSWFAEALSNFSGGNNVVGYAYPNPAIGNGSHLASMTIYWDATEKPLVTSVQVHSGSPSGTLIGSGGGAGSAVTPTNVSNGMLFYIQDVTGGKPLTAANTLGIVLANVQ